MEKRTLLAFVLSFIVLVTWSYFYTPKEAPAPEEPAQKESVQKGPVQSEAVTESDTLAQSTPGEIVKETAGPAQPLNEELIEIDTPLYSAVFSNIGPTIRSFKLKNYRQTIDPNSPLIELVNLGEGQGGFLELSFKGASLSQRRNTAYEVEGASMKLETGGMPRELVFNHTNSDGIMTKQTFRFYPDTYKIDFNVDVVNRSANMVEGKISALIRARNPEGKTGYYSFNGLVILADKKLDEIKIKKTTDEKAVEGNLEWMAYENAYFLSALAPESPWKGIFRGRLLQSGNLVGTYEPPALKLNPSAQVSESFHLYMGPRELDLLKGFGQNLDKAVNFGWTNIIAKPLLYVLRFFEKYIHNYGLAIIVLTILVKMLFWPLTHKSYKSMGEMKKIQPRIMAIREKYKHDKQQMNKEMMGLYRTYKVNPMGGCLPMVIQIPVFFALFRVLGSAIELRHAPFMLWITDLSAPDRLFHLPFKLPLMSPPYGIPVLTLLMGASMFLQQKMTPSPGDPAQAKMMMFLPLIFTFFFINFPSGLVLYWLVNNLLSIGQQYRILKRT